MKWLVAFQGQAKHSKCDRDVGGSGQESDFYGTNATIQDPVSALATQLNSPPIFEYTIDASAVQKSGKLREIIFPLSFTGTGFYCLGLASTGNGKQSWSRKKLEKFDFGFSSGSVHRSPTRNGF